MGLVERLWPAETEHDRSERVRAMTIAWPLIGVVGALDLLHRPTWPTAAVWASWCAVQAAFATAARRGGIDRARIVGTISSVLPSLALGGLTALTDGIFALVLFVTLAAVPFIDFVFTMPDLGGIVLAGAVGLAVGWPLLPRFFGGFAAGGWAWALGVVTVTAFTAAQAHARRARRAAEMRAERERAEAIEALAESRLARVDVEALQSLGVLADEVSHEVNSPLAAVKASIEYARAVLPGGSEDAGEALRDGLLGVERIRLIVARLQALRRGVAGRRYRRPLREAALDAIRIAEPWLAGRAEVANEVTECERVEAPWPLVVEMIACLLLQGAARQPDGPPAQIRVRGSAADERLVVYVDTPRSHGPRPAGLGHGIAICAEYARRLGGGLHVEDQLDGTRYALAIPLAPAVPAERAAVVEH